MNNKTKKEMIVDSLEFWIKYSFPLYHRLRNNFEQDEANIFYYSLAPASGKFLAITFKSGDETDFYLDTISVSPEDGEMFQKFYESHSLDDQLTTKNKYRQDVNTMLFNSGGQSFFLNAQYIDQVEANHFRVVLSALNLIKRAADGFGKVEPDKPVGLGSVN